MGVSEKLDNGRIRTGRTETEKDWRLLLLSQCRRRNSRSSHKSHGSCCTFQINKRSLDQFALQPVDSHLEQIRKVVVKRTRLPHRHPRREMVYCLSFL